MRPLSLVSADQSPAQHKRVAGQSVPRVLQELAAKAGFRFNGDDPWDIQVYDPRLYGRILAHGSLGFGEAYMDGWWDCQQLDQLFHRLMLVDADRHIDRQTKIRLLGSVLKNRLINRQSVRRAFQVGEQHYDIGNDVFEAMLDPTMSYSCAYWSGACSLAEAQRNKLDLICRKLDLRPGERLLDIGCGWGGLAQHAAREYGADVFGITVSEEQRRLARERCSGLPVRIELMDYRDLRGSFDKVVSVGMFEHVGPKNYTSFFSVVDRVLNSEGLFLLHTIGHHVTTQRVDAWIDKYVFPNGRLPSAKQITQAAEALFLIEDWHQFGADYDHTLMAWWERFERAWSSLEQKYGRRFYRMWKYYLMSCAGFFRSRQGQLWQVVLSKRGRGEAYRSVR